MPVFLPPIAIEQIVSELNVSEMSVRNWIKTGLLHAVDVRAVTAKSYEIFKRDIVGKDKLNSRANKLHSDGHDHTALQNEFLAKVWNNQSDKNYGDNLASEYEACLSDAHKNEEGIYYTPSVICDDMMAVVPDNVWQDKDTVFCDPCCGGGNFIVAALNSGIQPKNIIGFDTDKVAVEITKRRIFDRTGYRDAKITCGNFLEYCVQQQSVGNAVRYDVMITNPPWGKKSYSSKQERQDLMDALGLQKSTDTAALFTAACLNCLRDDGYLGLLLPDAFFNVAAFTEVREKVLEKNLVRLADYKKAFKGLVTGARAFTLHNRSYDKHAMAEQSAYLDNPNYIINMNASPNDIAVINAMRSVSHKTLATGNTRWGLGIVTGGNNRFVANSNRDGYIPVYKGKDITSDGLKPPSCFIPDTLDVYQQVAPRELFAQPKMLYKFISSKLVFCYDEQGSFVLNSVNFVIPDLDELGITPTVLTQYLNSDLIGWYHATIFDTHKILRSNLETLPIYTDFLKTQQNGFDEDALLEYLGLTRTSDGGYCLDTRERHSD